MTVPDPWEEIQATIDTLPQDRAAEVNLLADRASGQILGVRGSTERLLGKPEEEVRGIRIERLKPAGGVPQGEVPFETRLLAKAGYHGEVTIGGLDGTHRKVALRVHPFRAETGHALIFLRLLDVSEQLRLNRELGRAHRALKKAYRALSEQRRSLDEARRAASLSQFAAGLAHELNNPVGVAQSNLSSLRDYLRDVVDDHFDGKPPDDLEETFAITRDVAEALGRVSAIVGLLRELEIQARRDEFDLVQLLRSRSETLGLTFICDLQGIPMRSDPALVLTLLKKVVENAHAEAPEGGIACEVIARGDDGAEILIEDDGPGISEDLLERVFDPFFTTRPPGQGLGLGLFLARRTASLLGGSISLENRDEGGARARITLPRTLPEQADLRASYERLRLTGEADDDDIPIDISDFE